MSDIFAARLSTLKKEHDSVIRRSNVPEPLGNGIYKRWANPVITPDHVPLFWRYDMDKGRNPFLMERLGVNATFNAGAIKWGDKYRLVVRIEGNDRKSFFAIAESDKPHEGFTFLDTPIVIPQTNQPDTNVYDMRLTHHEDGYIYGLFCTERKDMSRPEDLSAAIAACGIVRTSDMQTWERLPDLVTPSQQQRNVVLHPEFINSQYGLYTRPQDGFITVGGGGGIGWGLCPTMDGAVIDAESIVDKKVYHTIKELKNGQGPAPLKTEAGWLHLGHGVRNTAAGLRYVLYLFVTDLIEPWRVIHAPGGYLIAPQGAERVGDVSNVVFANGWIRDDDDQVHIYYASSDTRLHLASTSIAQLLDYTVNTPADPLTSAGAVQQRLDLIHHNKIQ